MSKTKRNGGYVLVDFSGIEFTSAKFDTPQTPENPVYDTVIAAIQNNKPIFISNLTALDGEHTFEPFNVPMFIAEDDGVFVVSGVFSTFQIGISREDGADVVVISQM